jgi:predicted enzyme related to lactoylglutathione lyase
MFMNDMFISDFGAAYPIIISMIQRVPDHRNARQVRSELKAISTPVCKGRVRRCIMNRKKSAKWVQCCAATVCRLEGETDMVEDQGRFVWYELMTTDMAAAKAFYANVVGWGAQDASTPDLAYALFTAGGASISGLMDLPEDAREMGATPRWMGYVGVNDVDTTADRIKRLGGAVYVPPTDTNIGRISVVADPQTATLALVTGLKLGQQQPAELDELGHVGWHELLATDWEKAFAFYVEIFGWQKADAETGPTNTYQLFSARGQTIGGIFTKRPIEPVPYWLYYFNIGDIDAAAERVKTGGGKIFDGPIEVPGGSWTARCIDPQGAIFAMQGKRSQDGIRRASAPELGWSAQWDGISSKGRLVVTKPRG